METNIIHRAGMGHSSLMSESRVIPCPIEEFSGKDEDGRPEYYVTIPPRWLGEHAIAKDEALESAKESGLTNDDMVTFAVSLALADDYRLPGLEGKPENWDFKKLRLEVISWVNYTVHTSFSRDQQVKKSWLLASLNGHLDKGTMRLLGDLPIPE